MTTGIHGVATLRRDAMAQNDEIEVFFPSRHATFMPGTAPILAS